MTQNFKNGQFSKNCDPSLVLAPESSATSDRSMTHSIDKSQYGDYSDIFINDSIHMDMDFANPTNHSTPVFCSTNDKLALQQDKYYQRACIRSMSGGTPLNVQQETQYETAKAELPNRPDSKAPLEANTDTPVHENFQNTKAQCADFETIVKKYINQIPVINFKISQNVKKQDYTSIEYHPKSGKFYVRDPAGGLPLSLENIEIKQASVAVLIFAGWRGLLPEGDQSIFFENWLDYMNLLGYQGAITNLKQAKTHNF